MDELRHPFTIRDLLFEDGREFPRDLVRLPSEYRLHVSLEGSVGSYVFRDRIDGVGQRSRVELSRVSGVLAVLLAESDGRLDVSIQRELEQDVPVVVRYSTPPPAHMRWIVGSDERWSEPVYDLFLGKR